MKNILLISIVLFALFYSCKNQVTDPLTENYENSVSLKVPALKNIISMQLEDCLPKNWQVWEEFSEEKKHQLSHIGKAEFELHFKATYQIEDTFMVDNMNGKEGSKYHPEIILHFYKQSKEIKESLKFTRQIEIAKMMSTTHFAVDFAETKDYLVYVCTSENQMFHPKDPKILKLENCLKEKLRDLM